MFSYDVFDPSPGAPLPDLAYETLKVFPGQGSCAAYVGARFWGSVAAVTSAAAWLIAPVGLCSPHRRRRVGFAGSGMACCSVAWGLIAVSVWAGAVLNAATSEHGRAFWCMVAAVATAALSVPFLSAYGRVATACPEFQQPSPGSRYAHFPAYSAQQQYQYGSPGGLRPPPTAALAHAAAVDLSRAGRAASGVTAADPQPYAAFAPTRTDAPSALARFRRAGPGQAPCQLPPP
eukprot:CAMPEP_0177602114 /NCGR_PEP_ID=MMETSP0419_2-20121207/14682_1 /TAXON_ID=582737 /ORGANISM="Tetraselmis sp., Strain GSL018" /LENGTH=232 /DNA_ID=CAMNT_0019095549 /DNA_START=325 /DNA_END=1018 /DNA_ORIENTATION=-